MELTDYLALLGLVAGAIYLIMAALASKRTRARESAHDPHAGRVILSIEDQSALVEGEATADRMHKLAAICASTGRRAFGEELDFTVESIAKIDRAIMSGWGDKEGPIDPDVLLTFGAYVGEVLVRRTRGRWVSSLIEDDPGTVLFLGPGDETVNVSPFMLVREKFENMYKFDLSIAFTALEQKLKELKAA